MKVRSIWNAWMLVAALAILIPATALRAAPPPDNAEVNKLLDQAREHAMLADDDAAELESYTRSKLSWQSHALRLTTMKEHVNNLGVDVSELNRLRDQGSSWQQVAIDRINPLLREIADHLTTTIEHLNDNQGRIHMQAYRDYVKANSDLINRAHNMIADFVDYGQAKATAEAIQLHQELPSDSTGE